LRSCLLPVADLWRPGSPRQRSHNRPLAIRPRRHSRDARHEAVAPPSAAAQDVRRATGLGLHEPCDEQHPRQRRHDRAQRAAARDLRPRNHAPGSGKLARAAAQSAHSAAAQPLDARPPRQRLQLRLRALLPVSDRRDIADDAAPLEGARHDLRRHGPDQQRPRARCQALGPVAGQAGVVAADQLRAERHHAASSLQR
ncbi:hypothetical protein LTR16_010233, partial [Cryomyces antarcticus]